MAGTAMETEGVIALAEARMPTVDIISLGELLRSPVHPQKNERICGLRLRKVRFTKH